VRTHYDYDGRERRLADLKEETAELERRLDSVRLSLESELEQADNQAPDEQIRSKKLRGRKVADRYHHGDQPAFSPRPATAASDETYETYETFEPDDSDAAHEPDDDPFAAPWRTEVLVTHGRHGGHRPRLLRKAVIIAACAAVVVATIVVIVLTADGASWPASVATVQSEAVRACQNPDVISEPDQVNFACAPGTRQILWVFALMTSYDNPGFTDSETGRVGLEPIAPSQGGQVAWSLNLHHPYNPLNPVDSLAVAARAINSIIGGATVTSASGAPVVQSGLEASAANCVRYTGSAAVRSRPGFPGLCARPITTPAGQAALVADVYQNWMVGATPQEAGDAAVLFQNANNPGDPQVQSILQQLRNRAP
jgi:hypothetical protein